MSEPAETQVDDDSVVENEDRAGEWSQRRFDSSTDRVSAWAAILQHLPEFGADGLRVKIYDCLLKTAENELDGYDSLGEC